MQYKNKKTGVVIDTPCIINGEDWVPHVEKNKKVVEEVQKEQEAVVEELEETTDDVPEEIKKAQIMQELDAFGIKYNPRDKKQVLYDLMIAQGK